MKLKAVKFKGHHTVLQKGDYSVPVLMDREKGAYVSKWKMNFWDRLLFLFNLKSLWVAVYGGGHPPIYLACEKAIFEKSK